MEKEDVKQPFEHITSDTVPQGLFSRIIRRLGLERELLLIKKHLGFFGSLLGIFIFLSGFAFIGIRHELAESSFGPFLYLVISDPSVVMRYWHSYLFAVSETMPGIILTGFLIAIGLVLLSIKLVALYINRFSNIKKTINKN